MRMVQVRRVTGALALAVLVVGCRDSTGPGDDSRPPTLQLAAPAAGAVLEGDSVVVTGSAADNAGVAQVTYSLNGGPEQAVEAGGGTAVTLRFVARGTALGANQLAVHAYDQAGNRGSASVSFTVQDRAAPAVQVLSPGEGELVERDSVLVLGRVSDDRRVVRLGYVLDGGAEQAVDAGALEGSLFRFAVRGTAPGEHRVEVRAYDEAGNRGAQALTFTSGSAEVRITAPISGVVQASFAAPLYGYVDSPVPVARMTYSVNGGAERPFCHPPYKEGPYCLSYPQGRSTLTWQADSLPQGDVVVRVFAYDAQQQRIGAGRTDFRVRVPIRRYRVAAVRTEDGRLLYGTDVNERGQVTGVVGSYPEQKLFFWDSGRLTVGETHASTYPAAPMLSDSGVVAFMAPYASGSCNRTFTWKPGEAPVQVTTSNGGCHTLNDVTGAGKLLLWDENPVTAEGRSFRALVYDRGAVTLLHPHVRGVLLNDAGQAVGASGPSYGATYGWLSTDQFRPFGTQCVPKALNGRGDVLCGGGNGWVTTDGREIALPRVGRSGSNRPVSMNDRMQVVGAYTYYQAPTQHVSVVRTFLWDGGVAHAVELREGAQWESVTPVKLTDSGLILARGQRRGSYTWDTLLLTPEP